MVMGTVEERFFLVLGIHDRARSFLRDDFFVKERSSASQVSSQSCSSLDFARLGVISRRNKNPAMMD